MKHDILLGEAGYGTDMKPEIFPLRALHSAALL